MKTNQKWVVKSLVPEEVYTDRAEFLEYFYEKALQAATRRAMSTVLFGQRRMGKTEIFKRVVNRLFFEQDPKSENPVVPVYYCFHDSYLNEQAFAVDYIENFMRYYVGFYTSQPEMIVNAPTGKTLVSWIQESRTKFASTDRLDWILSWYDSVANEGINMPAKYVLETPRRVSDVEDSTIVMFLDEFQNTRLPQHNFDIVGFMQQAVESPTCPHFVTGSAMSILAKEIIGRGSLFGRFRSKPIEPLTGYWGAELALKVARYSHADISQEIAPVISDRCGGNPFYITAVVQQAAELRKSVRDEETVNTILAVDLSSGFIWGELNDQVTRWINRINEDKITKWILYLSALDENSDENKQGELNIERIQAEIRRREDREVPLDKIRDVLIKLSRGDLVQYLELGRWFRPMKDPILLEFLKVWGRIEVEGHNRNDVEKELIKKYQAFERRIKEYKGYWAEVHIGQLLLNGQNKTLPGYFFNTRKDIKMPWRFYYVYHRHRLKAGKGHEIDVLGGAGGESWVCQSKWIEGKKVGIAELNALMYQAQMVREEQTNKEIIRMWIFANDGLTREAKAFAKKNGILWSSRKEFDELLVYLGLRPLPEL